ncbi:hypothetical protein MUG84_19810 [Paenibacillus sp. KQZ6P-2]|uniref:Uncharacterized protein n=1 Tax=Paenibacillus mangrovi TaxID=2931978 RepID=A0A9X1WRK0_9BACL|nr:hypothetical protein [Paenibacillus mangrovi]MCJ8013977.1 hypothetical protein [Paenibacillus mangrovi]
MSEEYKTETDLTCERYENAVNHPQEVGPPENDFREVNTQTIQNITCEPEASDDVTDEYTELENVPDADDIQENSPVDPVATVEDMHGTDLINGYDGDDSE